MANEERENEELGIEHDLGEISEDLMKEHGEILPDDFTYIPGNEMPADLKSATPLGDATPFLEDKTQGASVRSTFDTRLINGTDFHHSDSQEVTPSDENDSTLTFGFTVPKSYVAILRKFKWVISPEIAGEPGTDLLMSIKVDGIAQIGHVDLVGIHQPEDFWDTHILVPEQSTVSLDFKFPATYSAGITYSVFVHLYGNLILSKNVPLAFEVGNPEASKSVPVPKAVNAYDPNAMRQTGQPQAKVRPPVQRRVKRRQEPKRRFYANSPSKGKGKRSGRLNLGFKR